ncbi:MAG: diguanylate cyclase [Acidimicrobiales bacterium]
MPDAARLSDQAPSEPSRHPCGPTDTTPAPDRRASGCPPATNGSGGTLPRGQAAEGGDGEGDGDGTGIRAEHSAIPDATVAATALLERLSTGAALIDHDGVVRWCNSAFAALRGVEPATVVGRSITTLHGSGDNPYASEQALRLDREPGAEYRFTRLVAGRPLVHVLRVIATDASPAGDAGGGRRWFVLETVPAEAGPVVRAGPFPEAIAARDGRLLAANDAFARLVGERASRLAGTSLFELVAGADAERLAEALADALAEPENGLDATLVEVHLARNDSRPSWAELALTATAAVGADPVVAVRARDVTDRKRDELLLAEVFDGSPSPYALVGSDGTVHSANPAWRHAFGAHSLGGRITDLLSGEDRSRLADALRACVAGRAGGCELTVVVDDGEQAPFLARVRATPLHDLSHRTERLLVTVEDLTEHALEVESARRSAAIARSALDDVDLAVTVHEPDGTIRELNLGAHRLFGPEATELVGHAGLPAWWRPQAADGSPLPEEDHPVHRVLAGHAPAAEAVIGLRLGSGERTDTRRWFLVRARALRDTTLRHRVGAVATYSDITTLHKELIGAQGDRSSLLGAIESLPVPAYQTGRDHLPVRVSGALRRLAADLAASPPARDTAEPAVARAGNHAGSRAGPSDTAPPAQTAGADHVGEPGDGTEVVVDLTSEPPARFDRPARGRRVTPPADRTPGRSSAGGPPGDPGPVQDLFDLVHRYDRRTVADALAEVTRQGATVRVQHRLAAAEGTHWVDHQITPLVTDGELDGFVGVLIPLPEWVAQGDRTRRLVRLVETANELVGEFELDSGRVTYLNPRAQQTFEVPDHHLDRLTLTDLYTADSDSVFATSIWPALLEHSQWDGELAMRTMSDSVLRVQQWITAEWEGDRIIRLVAVGHDVTARSRREAELAERASHDWLTGLSNRSRLLESLEAALARARRNQRLVALAFLDLDRFKLVNDRFGHEAGDQLLVQVAERLRSVVRPSDLVARLGGDEFVVLCDTVDDKSQAFAMAHRVANALSANPYTVDGTTVRVTASVGLALSRGTESPDGLLRNADAALYRAKETGRHRIALFDESMRSRVSNREILAEELRAALAAGDITVHYEPAIDLRSGEVRAVAALARWEHPERGLLTTTDFAEVAEAARLLPALCEHILSDAAERARSWQHRFGGSAPPIHVPVTSHQVVDASLVDTVAVALRRSGLRPGLLCLEIDEAVLLEDTERAIGTVRDLKALGVRLAIAGFGTGYSSLSYLSRLPVDVVKIDRSFVEAAPRPARVGGGGRGHRLARPGPRPVHHRRRRGERRPVAGCAGSAATPASDRFSAALAGDAIDAFLAERTGHPGASGAGGPGTGRDGAGTSTP